MYNSVTYRKSQLGQTNEAIKVAYMAGKRIFILVTKDFSIGLDIIRMESVLPLKKKTYDADSGTSTPSNFVFATSDSFFENSTKLSDACIFLYSGDKFPECSVKAFVDAIQGYTSFGSGNYDMSAVDKSIVMILTTSVPTGIPQSLNPYIEIINVPLIGRDEFCMIVSDWLSKNEGIPLVTDINGYKKISDTEFLDNLYHNMRGLSPVEITFVLNGIMTRHGCVYHPVNDRTGTNFMKILSEIRKDAERIISNVNALSLKDSTNAPRPAGLKNIDIWLEKYGDRICHPEKYDRSFVMQPPKGIIVSGVPGTGKSMMARHIARQLGRTLVRLDVGDAMGKYVGDTEKGFNDALRAAEELSPCILWIDEMEKAFQGSHEVTVRMIGKFLTWMQEKGDRGLSIFVFCTSNDISKMPGEMFRSGRFDEKYSVFMPSAKECGEIFDSQIQYQCSKYLNSLDSTLITKKLFDTSVVNGKAFKKILNTICIPTPLELKDKNYTRSNKFFTGADISSVIDKAKNIYINKGYSSSGMFVFESEKYLECLRDAISETRTYGETNLDDIVRCFVQLKTNNFFSASSDIVMPFEGYDEIRYSLQRRRQQTGESVEPELYSLADEHQFIAGKCIYDKQLYISIRNALNQMAEKIIKY